MTTTNESSTDNRFYREASAQPADGAPAFPSRRDVPYPGGGSYRDDRAGMTLRDYFAAKAMAGMLADPNFQGYVPETAELAYDYADAMLKARG